MFALINMFNTIFIISGAIMVGMLALVVIGILKNIIVAIIRRLRRHKKSK